MQEQEDLKQILTKKQPAANSTNDYDESSYDSVYTYRPVCIKFQSNVLVICLMNFWACLANCQIERDCWQISNMLTNLKFRIAYQHLQIYLS